MKKAIERRDILKFAAGASLSAAAAQASGANTIRVGFVGVGGRGKRPAA